MYNTREAISDAKTDSEPALTFGYNELLEEIIGELGGIELQPGDLTSGIIVSEAVAQGKYLNRDSASKLLRKLELQGRVKYVGKYKSGYGKENVYRPVKAGN